MLSARNSEIRLVNNPNLCSWRRWAAICAPGSNTDVTLGSHIVAHKAFQSPGTASSGREYDSERKVLIAGDRTRGGSFGEWATAWASNMSSLRCDASTMNRKRCSNLIEFQYLSYSDSRKWWSLGMISITNGSGCGVKEKKCDTLWTPCQDAINQG